MGILISIIVILLLIVGVIIKSLNTTSKGGKELHLPTRPTTVSLKDKITITLKTESEELLEKDEKNPDVVPANKGIFEFCRFINFNFVIKTLKFDSFKFRRK